VKTYEAIVKGHNVPQPGVPESFRVLVKELQSLSLDVRVLDKDGEEVILRDTEDDEPFSRGGGMQEEQYASENELTAAGFHLEDDPEDADESEFDYSNDDLSAATDEELEDDDEEEEA
jgi:DNA-directed RNA polymerase subunit beta